MSKLDALKKLAHARYNPAEPRDPSGRWTKAREVAEGVAAKGIVAGAGAIGHHMGGEAGSVAAMLAARTAVSLGKHAFESKFEKKSSQNVDALADKLESDAQGDVFGHFVAAAVHHGVGALADSVLPHGGQALGMAASAAITPRLVKAAKRLKGQLQPTQNRPDPSSQPSFA